MNHHADARFVIVTAAHHLLATILPFRSPDSHASLIAFLDVALATDLPSPEIDAVLLRTLGLLNRHAGGRLPTMVDRYLSADFTQSTRLHRFRQCVEDILRYRGIGDQWVQRAIATIDSRYSDSTLSTRTIAETLRRRPEMLAEAFRRQTGMNVTGYLRAVRLDRAAVLLNLTDNTVKEVWAAVGYNHASNFDHDFRDRFGESPREYRARGIVQSRHLQPNEILPAGASGVEGCTSVLIVDDDQATRETVGRYLTLAGHSVSVAADGQEGLREADRVGPHTILLDYQLPDVDGLTWLHQFRPRHPKTAVVMFSADWDLESKLDEVKAMGAILLSKLCDLEDIETAVSSGGELWPGPQTRTAAIAT